MNDDEVLNAMKQTLSDVQMDRPVEVIEQRGRARRRHRGLFGVVAGGGLAAVAALALVLPMASHQPSSTPTTSGLAAGSPAAGTQAMTPAAFALAVQADGSVKLILNPGKLLDPAALQQALAAAGIPAVVKAGVLCEPKGTQLPQAKEVFGIKKVDTPNSALGTPSYDLVINRSKMPKNSEVYLSVFPIDTVNGYAKFAKALVLKGAPMSCRSVA